MVGCIVGVVVVFRAIAVESSCAIAGSFVESVVDFDIDVNVISLMINVAVFDNVCMVLWLLNDCDFAADVFPVVVVVVVVCFAAAIFAVFGIAASLVCFVGPLGTQSVERFLVGTIGAVIGILLSRHCAALLCFFFSRALLYDELLCWITVLGNVGLAFTTGWRPVV